MKPGPTDRLRRKVHAAVSRTGELRADGCDDAADRLLAEELAAVARGLCENGEADVTAVLHRWVADAELSLAYGRVADRPAAGPAAPAVPAVPPECAPGLVDLLGGAFDTGRATDPPRL